MKPVSKDRIREIIRNAMQAAKGNKLEHAYASFKQMTPEQLQQQFGRSGETNQQVWDEYKQQREEWLVAYEVLQDLDLV